MEKTITAKQTKEIAELANVKLTDAQAKKFSEGLSLVIAYMDQVKQLDLHDVAQTSRVTDEVNVLAEDVVEPSLSQKEALKNGKNYNGYFIVEYVFGKDADEFTE